MSDATYDDGNWHYVHFNADGTPLSVDGKPWDPTVVMQELLDEAKGES